MEDSDYAMKDIEREMEIAKQNEIEGKRLLKQFLIAQIESKETGVLEDESAESYFAGFADNESLTDVLLRQLSHNQTKLLNKQLDSWTEVPIDEKKKILTHIKHELHNDEISNIISGEYASSKPINTKEEEILNAEINKLKLNSVSDKLLADSISEFIQNYIDTSSRGNAKGPARATITSYEGILKEFIRIVGGNNIKCSDITKYTIKNYDINIWKVPKSFMKLSIYDGLDIDSVIKLGEEIGTDKKKNETVKNHTMRVKEFLKWAEREEYIISGLGSYLQKVPGSNERPDEKVDKFTDEELNKLFNNEIYELGKFKNEPSRYWIPLISLFTGMRGEEIAQLYKDDIIKDNDSDIWCFNLVTNLERNQTLKNKSARRQIPIHSQLKQLGFLEYVEKIKSNTMIFPELFNEEGKYYKKFGNNFNRKSNSGWMWKLGVKSNTNFHSFRHTVTDYLDKKGVHQRIIAGLVGHNYSGGVVLNYIKPDDLKTRYDAIKKLSFSSIDWNKIGKRRW